MFAHLEPILQDLRPCFSRQAAFEWFVIIIIGFLIRCDHTGLTSIVRWLFLTPQSYELIFLTVESFSRLYESFSHVYRASDGLFQK